MLCICLAVLISEVCEAVSGVPAFTAIADQGLSDDKAEVDAVDSVM